jgi:hypothetical protein
LQRGGRFVFLGAAEMRVASGAAAQRDKITPGPDLDFVPALLEPRWRINDPAIHAPFHAYRDPRLPDRANELVHRAPSEEFKNLEPMKP